MGKKALTALLGIILLAGLATAAEFSAQKAYDWMASNSQDGGFGAVPATAWALLAFNNANLLNNADDAMDWIFEQQNANYCFPLTACKTLDTSMALIAMDELKLMANATEVEEKLKSMIIKASLPGSWAIEVSPLGTGTGTGECTVSWEDGNNVIEKTIAVSEGKFTSCQNSYFLDLERCLQPSPLSLKPGTIISVDCTKVEGSKTITLIYKNSNKFYIVKSDESDKTELAINNGCFSLGTADATCRKDETLYALWAANRIGSSIDTTVYLAENYDAESPFDNAMLYLSTKDSRYLAVLKNLQKPDGSFDRAVMKTAQAVLALKEDSTYSAEVAKATEWLKSKQGTDGRLGTLTETAAALYAAFGDIAVEEPVDNETGATAIEGCGDDYCDTFAGEDEDTCPEDCEVVKDSTYSEEGCNYDGFCDYDESADTCPEDCEEEEEKTKCGDGKCDFGETENSCPDDCSSDISALVSDEGSGWGTWIIVIIVLIALGGGGYYAYTKGMIFKPKKPVSPFAGSYSFKPRPPTTPSTLQQKPSTGGFAAGTFKPSAGIRPEQKQQSELDKSLEEARKLLRK